MKENEARFAAALGPIKATRTQLRRALHSVCADLSDIGADRPFAGMAFDKMRRPGPSAAQHAGVENVPRPFHTQREPQQSTRFGPSRNSSFSRSKDGIFLIRLPSGRCAACAPPAATSLRLTRMGSCRTKAMLFMGQDTRISLKAGIDECDA
jgi:hypothetical protein